MSYLHYKVAQGYIDELPALRVAQCQQLSYLHCRIAQGCSDGLVLNPVQLQQQVKDQGHIWIAALILALTHQKGRLQCPRCS